MGTPKWQSGRFGFRFGLTRNNLKGHGVKATVGSRTGDPRQLNDTCVLDQGEGLAGIEEEGSARRGSLAGKDVGSNRPVLEHLSRTEVASLSSIKCLLLPGADLVAEFTDNNRLDLVDSPKVETDG